MDPRIANGLAAGRVQFRTGKRAAAIATWKDALRIAYETQHHAAAFVLSKNLGDATLATPDLIHEAIGYFDYALELLEGCGLQEEFAFYPPLENVVQYIRRRRRRAKRIIEAALTPPPIDTSLMGSQLQKRSATEKRKTCTTCEQPRSSENPIVMDEADGCLYCQSCFKAYYAEVEVADTTPLSVGASHPVGGDFGFDNCNGAIEENGSSLPQPDLRLEAEKDPAGLMEQLTIRENADSTSSTPCNLLEEAESTFEEASLPSNDVPVGEESTPYNGSVDDLIDVAQSTPPPNAPFVYSIQQLKTLRQFDLLCPPEIQASAVLATTTNNETKKSHPSKSVKRIPTKMATPSDQETVETKAPTTSSLLPTLAECHAARASFASLPTPFELASKWLDATHGTTTTSLATQLQYFSSAG